ncbi:hypothetical protein D3Z55_20935 [Clostridiaceae bacterium]|jgi:hypothetical protein|nr:hypothetical protein [Clostridiaceae bacterium]
MIFWEKNKMTVATCGIQLNHDSILWTSWINGDLYKLNLNDYHIEFLKSTIEVGHYKKAFSCILRHKEKIYLICLYDCYEIIEYDIPSDQLRLLYQNIKEGIEIFQAFLVDEILYLIPDKTCHDICVYSLKEERAIYIGWKELLFHGDLNIEDKFLYSMHLWKNRIYGAIHNTPYIFCLEVQPEIKCKVYKLEKSYKLGNIFVNGNEIYLAFLDRNTMICFDQDMNQKAEWNIGEKAERENVEQLPFIDFVMCNQELVCFPFGYKDKIQVIHTNTGNRYTVDYPDEFHTYDNNERLFWNPVMDGNQVYLLPHGGKGMLVLDLDSHKLKHIELKMNLYHQVKKNISINDREKQRNDSKKVIGNLIYNAGKK